MLRYEWKKILLRRGGWLLVLLLLAVELGSLLLFTTPYDSELENNREVYDSYLSQVLGSMDADKREFLESEMARLTQVHLDMDEPKSDYYLGELSEEEYRSRFSALLPEDQKYIGFTKLYSQYIFVRESEIRSFLYTGGWELLLTDWEPDYLFLLVLVILLTPVFCEEYACKMQDMLITQRRSARYIAATKVAASLLLTGALTAIVQVFDLVYMAARFGLANGDFTVQSLMTFGTTTRNLSIWQAFWLQFALKELGAMYAAVLILFLSVLLKKFSLTLMAGIAILPLPFLTVGDPQAFVAIPGPWALTIGSIYLGSDRSLAGIVLPGALIILGMLWVIARKNTNFQLKGRRRAALAALACMLLLAGCGGVEDTICFNYSDNGCYETDRYLIEVGFWDATITDKTTGETQPFPLDALEGVTVGTDFSIFGVGDTVYYKKTLSIYQNYSSEYTSFEPHDVYVKLDLNTMEETILYQWNSQTDWFFSQLQRPDWENRFTYPQFLHDSRLYCVFNREFGYIDITTGAYTVVYETLPSLDLAYDGESIYYLDNYSRLNIENLDTGDITVVDEVVAKRILLTPEGLFFLNLRDEDTLYCWDAQAGTVEKRCDIPGLSLKCRSDGLWLTDLYNTQHCLNPDGTEKE